MDYTTSLLVDESPQEVFEAVSNVRNWWSNDIEGETDKLGATFTFKMLPYHVSTHKITTYEPGKKIVWHTVDSEINFVNDKKEWKGTDIVFEITKEGDKTKLTFTHLGLKPVLACYGDCKNAWAFYIETSLKDLISTGKGQPTVK